MRWFKLFAEARNDAKLRVLTDAEFRAWFGLLCLASEQKVPGALTATSRFLLAIEVCNGDEALLEATLKKLVALQIVALTEGDEITFLHFAKRQSDKPSNHPEQVAERQRRHRAKAREAQIEIEGQGVTQGNEPPPPPPVTPCHAASHPRREESRTEENTPPEGGGPEAGSAERASATSPTPNPPPTEIQSCAEFQALQQISGWWWGVKTPRHDRELAASAAALRNKASPAATPENIALFGQLWEQSGKTKAAPGQVVSEWENVLTPPRRKEPDDRFSTRTSSPPYASIRQRASTELDRVLAEQGIQ